MARYAPLPSVSIDPRNEASLVQRAAQVVYESSNKSLNDFSSGNPLAALLEGQAFAQGEFLFWANQLPDKILIEWIGPFLGGMRRLGTPSTALLEISISPSNSSTVIPSGSSFSTDQQLTNGISYEFTNTEDLIIPAGESTGSITVYSKFLGSEYNVAANTITVASASGISQIQVKNPYPAIGGSDVETYDQVKERLFSLIRRKNPVSQSDWEDFFIDFYGAGTVTSVQPNRSSKYQYNYKRDYVEPNGQVSFFVLGPNGVELSDDQIASGQTAVNYRLPVGYQGHLFPITLSEVQYNMTLEVDTNGAWGRNFSQSSLNFRNRLFGVLQPNSVFPSTVNPSPSDIDSAFYSTFDTNLRYTNPHIQSSQAFNTPNTLSKEIATNTKVLEFNTSSFLLNEKDLVRKDDPNPTFFPVESSFTPYSSNKFDQTVYGNLKLKQIKNLSSGSYFLEDVVYYDGKADSAEEGLHVILDDVKIRTDLDILDNISSGKISSVKNYSPWVVGNSYVHDVSGTLNPEIVQYDYSDGHFIPATPFSVPLNNRPGALVWLVGKNFTLQNPSNDIDGAYASSKLGDPITPYTLQPGNIYNAGTWVFTPQIGSGPDETLDPNFFYVDVLKGGVTKHAYVVSSFTYNPTTETISEYFESLKDQGILQEIHVWEGNEGLPIFRYSPRFKAGQYLEYRQSSDSIPSYFIATEFFTPSSTEIQELSQVINLAPTAETYNQFSKELNDSFSGKLGTLQSIDTGFTYVNGNYTDVTLTGGDGVGGSADIIVSAGVVVHIQPNSKGQMYRVSDRLTVSGLDLGGSAEDLQVEVLSIEPQPENPLLKPVRMFTFFKGDKTLFRGGSTVQAYVANSSVTPLFDFEVYYNNGVFSESTLSNSDGQELGYIPFYTPDSLYAEDTIEGENGKDLYRVMKAFSPEYEVSNWTGTGVQVNSCRYEEFVGNLLRYVVKYTCDEPILSQFGQETSSYKLGVSQITIVPKNSTSSDSRLTFVWENGKSLQEVPELSWYTGSKTNLLPPDYKEGTLSL